MTEPARPRFRIITRGALLRLTVLAVIAVIGLAGAYRWMVVMPGASFSGPLPDPTPASTRCADRLRRDVTHLAGTIAARNHFAPIAYDEARVWLEGELVGMGYDVELDWFDVSGDHGVTGRAANIVASRTGSSPTGEIIVIGAHYDSFDSSPGANDNASGVAATLELARRLVERPIGRSLRIVLFANEEPPFFQTESMGSYQYAKACRERGDDIIGMLSLETIGYYSDDPGSQTYPPPLNAAYPDRGNFVGFVTRARSRRFLHEVIGEFRSQAEIASEGGALFGGLPGVGWSDHWAFWQFGYEGMMITDSAPYRYPFYHTINDTPDRLDYTRMSLVVEGLEPVLGRLLDGR